jgi:hypothetical protein
MTRGHAPVTVALAMASLLMSGCTDDPGPGTQPLPRLSGSSASGSPPLVSTRTSPVPTSALPTPTATSPSQPRGSGTPRPTPSRSSAPSRSLNPKSEVDQFVREYFAAANLAASSGHTAGWRALMASACVCRSSADYIDERTKAGGLRGLRWRVVDVSVQSVRRATAVATVQYNLSAYSELRADGTVAKRHPSFTGVVDALTVAKVDGRWMMSSVRRADFGTRK